MTRMLIPLLLVLAIDLYSFQALRAWLSTKSVWARRVGYGLFWSVTAITLALAIAAFANWLDAVDRANLRTVSTILFLLYLSKIPVVALLFLDDLRRLGVLILNKVSPVTKRDTSRSRFLSRAALLAGGVPLATLTYGIVRNAYRYRRFTHQVAIPNLPEALRGLKIVQISDMHSGSWTKSEPLHDAVELINRENADIVCFTGDIVNNKASEMLPYVDIFKNVRAKYGVYSTLGNHDYGDYEPWPSPEAKAENMELLFDVHRRLGWDLLNNENRILDINGAQLGILGVENWSANPRFPTKGDLAAAHVGTESCDCRILLSHDPTHWDAQVRPDYPDIDLTLSGHTHGFQFGVEIPGFRWSPAQYLYEQWAGLYQQGNQFLNVNRGLGFLGYPGRVGILPEVTVIELV